MKWFRKQNAVENRINAEVKEIVEKTIDSVLTKATENSHNILKLQKDISSLTEEKRTLKDDLADLQKQKELEKTEIEHLVALKEQRMELTIQKKEVELERKFQEKELELRKKGFDEMVNHINKQSEDMKSLYGQILERLPNVNMEIKEKRGK